MGEHTSFHSRLFKTLVLGVVFNVALLACIATQTYALDLPATGGGRVNIVVMLDLTGSTNANDTPRNDLELEKKATRELLLNFAANSNRPYIAIGTFNVPTGKLKDGDAARIIQNGEMTNDYGKPSPPTKLYAALDSLTSTTGYTDISAAINTAQAYISAQPAGIANFIILISDGTPNRPGLSNYENCGACGCEIAYNAAQAASVAALAAGTQVIAVHYAGSNPSTQFCAPAEPQAGSDFLQHSVATGPDYFFSGTDNLSNVFSTVLCSIRCNDNDPCTQDSCESGSGACHHEPIADDRDNDGVPDCRDACSGSDSDIGLACASDTLGACHKSGVFQCSPQGSLACIGSTELDRAACFGCVDTDESGTYLAVRSTFDSQVKALKASLARLKKAAKKNTKAKKVLATALKSVLAAEQNYVNHLGSMPLSVGSCADTISCYQVSHARTIGALSSDVSAVETVRKNLEKKLKSAKFKLSNKEKSKLNGVKNLNAKSMNSLKGLPTSGSSCQ